MVKGGGRNGGDQRRGTALGHRGGRGPDSLVQENGDMADMSVLNLTTMIQNDDV